MLIEPKLRAANTPASGPSAAAQDAVATEPAIR
jgi:hypothetical protein